MITNKKNGVFMPENAVTVKQAKTPFDGSGALGYHLIDHAVSFCVFGKHEVIALGIALDFFQGLAGIDGHDAVELLACLQDVAGMDFNVRCLALRAARRLVNHHPRIR